MADPVDGEHTSTEMVMAWLGASWHQGFSIKHIIELKNLRWAIEEAMKWEGATI